MTLDIHQTLKPLRAQGIRDVHRLETKLAQNALEPSVVEDLLAEAHAAFMLATGGLDIELSDRPDLIIHWNGQIVGAEVKHFRLKGQDTVDDVRLKEESDFLVEYGDTMPSEGRAAWEQVAAVVLKKAEKAKPGVPNLLVIQSSSTHCIEETQVKTAVSFINQPNVRKTYPTLARLNMLIFMSRNFNLNAQRSVFAFDLNSPEVPSPSPVHAICHGIREWTALDIVH